MISWQLGALIGFSGFFLGALVMAIVAAGRCADCETIGRIIKGGSK